MIQDERLRHLNELPIRTNGEFVLYWMQTAQRTRGNHALEYALREANRLALPLLVYFGVTDAYPHANLRHYHFMEEGLLDVARNLSSRSIPFLLQPTDPARGAQELARRAALLVADGGSLRHEKAWRRETAKAVPCKMIQVETNVLIPVETVSSKEEYSAATIRRKIERLLSEYTLPLTETELVRQTLPGDLESARSDEESIRRIFAGLNIDPSVPPVSRWYAGGEDRAQELLEDFLHSGLAGYAADRNDPAHGRTSDLSPYLHFGQISPLQIVLALNDHAGGTSPDPLLPAASSEDRRSFLDELIVRRELAVNFVHYNDRYDTYDAITGFARQTLDDHAADPRPWLYDLDELASGATHDPYWNAAQQEMVLTGKMNGYMRMYWGKKVLEWSPDPSTAYERLVTLNDRYSLDGRDANGYAGIAWCFGKHDRGYVQRPVFGKVRYMNDNGLLRKFNMSDYLEKVDRLKP